jgi:hypothetical protein
MSDEKSTSDPHRLPDADAEAAAVRWGQTHPAEDVDHPPPSQIAEDDHIVPNRHSASAEAAALRWREQHDEDE